MERPECFAIAVDLAMPPRSHDEVIIARLADLGVRRISVGSALACVAWGAFMRAAREIAQNGAFEAFADAALFDELNDLFQKRGLIA